MVRKAVSQITSSLFDCKYDVKPRLRYPTLNNDLIQKTLWVEDSYTNIMLVSIVSQMA
jgi:hypothetical protein